VILPTINMTVTEWTDMMALELERYGVVSRLDEPERWKDWANRVIAMPKIAVTIPPVPDLFNDWREWAERFVQIARAEV
jgi:hypothetical protein